MEIDLKIHFSHSWGYLPQTTKLKKLTIDERHTLGEGIIVFVSLRRVDVNASWHIWIGSSQCVRDIQLIRDIDLRTNFQIDLWMSPRTPFDGF